MRFKTTLAFAVCVLALLASVDVPRADDSAKAVTSGDGPRRAYRKRQPLQVDIYRRRIGGYSYSTADVMSSSPAPFTRAGQTPSGPFDSNFFFDSGIGPQGGNAPYLH